MKIHFGHLLAAASLAVAGCAAFFSVFGLSQLFAGASLAVIIMASSLEFSKIIAASFLHKYWKDMAKALKVYLTIGVVVLVTITSAGIYGFLSSAYQKTASNLEIHNGEVGILNTKIVQFESKIKSNKELIETRTKRINQLNDLRNSQESRLSDSNRRAANATRGDIQSSNSEIKELNVNIDELTADNNKLMDSIGKYNVQKLDKTAKSDVAAEVGPLKYLAELTGKPMDVVVNYFILLLVFVFDPLAISLVIATTWVFERERLKKIPVKEEIIEDLEDDDELPYDFDYKFDEFDEDEITWSELEGSDLDEPVELVEDVKIIEEEIIEPEIIEEPVTEIEEEEIEVDDSVHLDEVPLKPVFEPVIPTGKVERNEIKEIKERERGFTVKIPEARTNIQRIGSQKSKDDNNNIIYKK